MSEMKLKDKYQKYADELGLPWKQIDIGVARDSKDNTFEFESNTSCSFAVKAANKHFQLLQAVGKLRTALEISLSGYMSSNERVDAVTLLEETEGLV